MNIAQWLEEIGFGNYSELFEENGIDASILSELTNDDLKDIGIARLGDRKKILLAAASAAVSSDDDSATSSQAAAKTTPPPPPPEPGNTGRHISAAANNTAAEAENRQLSVMFCDLVGSTELSTKIDAEDLREIINRFQHTCTQIAQQAGGFVARYSGDGILVYFGYPRAGEDDPVRAVNCGLQITQAVARTNTQVRVGIATGRVIVGDLLGTGPAEERTVVGETPNLAARLQGLAGINAVVISDTTRQLVGGVYTFRDLGRHSLKGFANPVPAWEVSGESSVNSRFMARAGQSTSDLVGRESELRLLLDRWQAALDGEGQTVFVSGEAGIGKSHLIEALRAQTSAHNPRVVRYQCSAHHSGSALYPAIRQLQHAANFEQADGNDEKLAKLEQLLTIDTIQPTTRDLHLLAHLVTLDTAEKFGSLDDPADQIKAQTLEALITQLLTLAQSSPVLFLIEDGHWIDPTTLALIEAAIQRIHDSRVLLPITHRPDWQPVYSGVTTCSSIVWAKQKALN